MKKLVVSLLMGALVSLGCSQTTHSDKATKKETVKATGETVKPMEPTKKEETKKTETTTKKVEETKKAETKKEKESK